MMKLRLVTITLYTASGVLLGCLLAKPEYSLCVKSSLNKAPKLQRVLKVLSQQVNPQLQRLFEPFENFHIEGSSELINIVMD